jgi:hypothetical protein
MVESIGNQQLTNNNQTRMRFAPVLALGIAIGVVVGVSTKNYSVGFAVGVAIILILLGGRRFLRK